MNSKPLPPLESRRENPNYDTYEFTAACYRDSGEGGFMVCCTPKGKRHLTLIDFYRTETPPPYTGSVDSLPEWLREKARREGWGKKPSQVAVKKTYQIKPTS